MARVALSSQQPQRKCSQKLGLHHPRPLRHEGQVLRRTLVFALGHGPRAHLELQASIPRTCVVERHGDLLKGRLGVILDVLKYWVDVFKVDGFRFDYTLGFYKPDDKAHGLLRLLSDLQTHLTSKSITNFVLILEHLSEPRYTAIDVVNRVNANSCWYQRMLELSKDYLYGPLTPEIMRLLDSNRDFASGAPTTYIETHDHTTSEWHADNSGDGWKVQPHAIALFTCAGAPMIHNGQEWGQKYWFPEPGNDGRVQSRKLQWGGLATTLGARQFWLYSTLAFIRSNHPGLRSPNFYPPKWQDWQTKPDGNYGTDV
jgi:pullulanase